jgi:hypothetical protein
MIITPVPHGQKTPEEKREYRKMPNFAESSNLLMQSSEK